jgi:hypothetical protein
MAAATWAPRLAKRRVIMRCDNEGVVEMLNRDRCRCGKMMVAMRELAHIMARGSFELRSKWVASGDNTMADLLSRACKDPKAQGRFFEYVRERYGLGREATREVAVPLDTRGVLRKMRRAFLASERRQRRRGGDAKSEKA